MEKQWNMYGFGVVRASQRKSLFAMPISSLLVLLLTSFFSQNANAQVNGVVTDGTTQQPLKNATVRVGQNGTTTNRQGEFSLPNVQPNDTLIISYVGYLEQSFIVAQAGQQFAIAMDRTGVALNEVNVSERKNRLLAQMEGAPVATPKVTLGGSNSSPTDALNVIPGVYMEERGQGGSRRLSIRGSSLRSPFGVRNVKVYYDDLPLTSPDGSTPLEVVDLELIRRMKLIRGPVANAYGGVNGGTLHFYSRQDRYEQRAAFDVATTFGDFGLQRYVMHTHAGNDRWRVSLGYSRQNYGGYRQQEFNNKDFINYKVTYIASRHFLTLTGFYFNGAWGLPGAIDSAAVAEDPTQAVQFSIDNDAHVQRERMRTGLVHRWNIREGMILRTVAYFDNTTKINPFGTSPFFNGYKDEQAAGFGGRTALTWHKGGWLSQRYHIGAEYQTETNELLEWNNELGQPGSTQRLDNQTTSTNAFGFAQADFTHRRSNTTLTLGANYGQLIYDLNDRLEDPIDYSGTSSFAPQFLPRVGLMKEFDGERKIYLDWSLGQSAPVLWEVQLQEGGLNNGLNAENASVMELGYKGSFFDDQKLFVQVNAYLMNLDNAIVPKVDSFGAVVYDNSGTIEQRGLELKASYTVARNLNNTLSLLRFWANATLQDFQFDNYIKEGEDLSGNELTGVPRQLYAAGMNLSLKNGLYLNTTVRYVSEIPIDDANTAYANAYTLLNARAGYRVWLSERFRIEAFGGVNNLLDESYSAFLQLNGFGGRYFNPAAPRNFYGGARLHYTF